MSFFNTVINGVKSYIRLKLYAPFRINKHASFYSSHSQFGEDMVLRSMFGNKKDGIFVDLGAHHPVYYSNTYHFYLKGWRGVNIDAKPGSMTIFNQIRPGDNNIEACIGSENKKDVTFFEFRQSAFNTIDPEMAKQAISSGHQVLTEHRLETKTLDHILSELNISAQDVDFFNIDIEGLDRIVLENNNWDLFRPKVIAFEDHQFDIHNLESCHTLNFLLAKGYEFKSKCGPTIIVALKS